MVISTLILLSVISVAFAVLPILWWRHTNGIPRFDFCGPRVCTPIRCAPPENIGVPADHKAYRSANTLSTQRRSLTRSVSSAVRRSALSRSAKKETFGTDAG